jgi:site-specific DNA recombinase
MYLDLKSIPEVAFQLNRDGIKTKRGGKWSPPAVKHILDNELYIGRYKVAGVDDYVENYRIIEDELFDQSKEVRFRFKKSRKMSVKRKEAIINHIFDEYLKFLRTGEEEESFRVI